MNIKIILHITGKLLLGLALFLLLPLIATWYYSEADLNAFLIPSILCTITALLCIYFFQTDEEISNREGFAIVTGVWIVFSIFGGLPYMLSTPSHSFTHAFFETMSGFTTTGSSIFADIESHTRGILLWRSITQWIGGMGIIVLTLAILPILGIGGMQLFKAEVPGPTSDKLTPRVHDTAKILWQTYITLTLVEIFLLWIGGMSFYDSINHSLCTLSSGGFSPSNTSIAVYDNSFIHFIIIIFMIFAGVNFANHYQFSKGQYKRVFQDQEMLSYLGLLFIITVIIVINLFWHGVYQDLFLCVRDVLFTATSLVTTTGFASADFETWPVFSQFLLFCLLFTGGCAGSTGGGVKIIRLLMYLKFAYQQIYQLVHPNAIIPLKVSAKPVPTNVMLGVLGFLVLYIFTFVSGTILMTAAGLDLISASSAAATALGNIGPGLGSIGPTDNFSHVSNFGLWVLSFLMLIGRLELFTVLILFTPAFWKD